MQRFIDAFTGTLGDHVPAIVGAIILFAVGYLISRAVQFGLLRLLQKLKVDERLNADHDSPYPISELVSKLGFYLLLVYVILITLEVIGVSGVLNPAQEMLSNVLTMLPNVLTAGLIGVAGYLIARIVATGVGALATSIDSLGPKVGLGDNFKISKLLDTVVFVVVFVPILISALDALKISTISDPATTLFETLLASIPSILGAGIILFVALLAGRFIRDVLKSILSTMGADDLVAKAGAGPIFGGSGFSAFVSNLVFFFIMLGAAISAVETLSLEIIAGSLQALLHFTSQVVVGLAIIVVGNFLANLAYRQLGQDGKPGPLAHIARFAILGLVLAMGLAAMGIAENIVQLAFMLTLGSVAVAAALAFGLGGREAAGKHLDHWLTSLRKSD